VEIISLNETKNSKLKQRYRKSKEQKKLFETTIKEWSKTLYHNKEPEREDLAEMYA
jgi:hypothetical protein